MSRTIIYVGDDGPLFRRLDRELQELDYELEGRDESSVFGTVSDWYRLALIDCDVARPAGFDLMQSIKQQWPGAPIIILGPTHHRELTQLAVARQANAEAIFFKPLEDIAPLFQAIDSAFLRLDRWRSAFTQVESSLQLAASF